MAEQSSAISESQVLEAVRRISDPDRGGDIVTPGMVSGMAIRDGNVAFAIEVDPERGQRLEPLRKAAEKAVFDLPGVSSVTAVLTAHRGSATPRRPEPPPQAPRAASGKLTVPGVR